MPLDGAVLLSGGAVLAGSLSFAVATVYAKRAFRGGPTATSTVTFLVPAFGPLFGGVLFLGEPLGAGMLAGLATILLGVALTTGVRPSPPGNPGR